MGAIRLAAAIAAVLAMAGTMARADAIPLNTLSNYINRIDTAESTFTQVNSDGTVSTGDIYIHRPGRMRFDYDGDELLVMAGGGTVAIFDGRSNTSAEQYPLSETPLNLILDRNVDLARSGMVLRHGTDGTATRVLARDPDQPDIGTIELVFTPDPVELRQWVITDSGGAETTVILGPLEQGGTIPARSFNIPQELNARRGE